MPEIDVMPPAGIGDETDEQRRQKFARLPIPDSMPPAPIGAAQPQPASPMAATMPPANLSPQPRPMASAGPSMPPAHIPTADAMAKAPLSLGQMPPHQINPTVAPEAPAGTAPEGTAARNLQDLQAKGAPKLPWWKEALDVIGSIHPLGREIEANIPGSPQNYSAKMNQAAIRAAKEQELTKGQQEINAAPGKADLERRNTESEITARGDKDTSALAKLGLTRDKDGNVVADEESPVYKQNQDKDQRAQDTEKTLNTLREAQKNLADARTAVEKAKNDPNSPAYKEAQARLAMAQQAHSIAAQNLGLHEQEFANRVQEQDLVKPSGQAQSRGSAAQAALDVMPKLEELVKKNGSQMGVTMGRINRGELALGNVDPDVAELYGAMKSFYALQPAIHGFRSAEFVKDLETAIGTLERNPEAFLAGMKGLKPTMESVAKEGVTSHRRIVDGGGNSGGGETQVHNGYEYSKGKDGQWHKGNKVQ